MKTLPTVSLLLLVLVLCHGLTMTIGYREEEDWSREKERQRREPEDQDWSRERERERRGPEEVGSQEEDWFLLQDSKEVVKTDAGYMRVVRSVGGRIVDRPMHIGFITMEPKSLFVPQYIDSSLVIFVRRGEATVGNIYKDDLVEKRVKTGDVYRIPAGSTFYFVNTGEGQRLHIICSIDPSESLGLGAFQSFFVGGGSYPTSVLAGFDHETLTNAFNVSGSELKEILTRQSEGPIVYITESHAPNMWSRFLQLKEQDRVQYMKRMVEFHRGPREEEEEPWSWRKLLNFVFVTDNGGNRKTAKSPDSYNIYNKRANFKNNYGWSVTLDGSDYSPLKHSGIGVYLVNLTAGSMMAPHVNPTATEYGVVLRGSGRIQIVYPNGTSALNAQVKEGDVFWVPRYFPFCQIASRTGPFEFFGFTTSAHKNRPQFLVGASSLLQSLPDPVLATAFGVSEDKFKAVRDAQREAVILPSASAAPPEEGKPEREPKVIKSFV